MVELLELISKIEDKRLFNLYAYVKHLFDGKHLPSHDENHHVRVWLHCRGLLIEFTRIGFTVPEQLVENALIACFFHDTGLIDEIGEKHGKRGAEICADYLVKTNFPKGNNFDRIIEAIERHDDKSIKSKGITSPSELFDLDRLVSTADDLDSIGYIGVFRYIEIYLKRGIQPNELPHKVIKNIANRRSNFITNYSSLYLYCSKQMNRFTITYEYFTALDALMVQNSNENGKQLEVFNIFAKKLIDEGQPLDSVIHEVLETYTEGYILQFFSRLRDEINVVSVIIPDVRI